MGKETLDIGAKLIHPSRGQGVVHSISSDGTVGVLFEDGDVHRYQEKSWHKLSIVALSPNMAARQKLHFIEWTEHGMTFETFRALFTQEKATDTRLLLNRICDALHVRTARRTSGTDSLKGGHFDGSSLVYESESDM